ncbi:hypothetical protein ACHAWX_007030 [Stephanocyclus meneghinianus]
MYKTTMIPKLHGHLYRFLLALFAKTTLDPAAIVFVDSWSPSIRSATRRSFAARHASQPSAEAAPTTTASRPGKSSWFPIHPADALSPGNDYDTIVKSAYLRHVLVETEQMADLIVDVYLSGGRLQGTGNFIIDDGHYDTEIGNHALEASNDQTDIFARLARQTSTCTHTRIDGGEIGWVDNPRYKNRYNVGVMGSTHDASTIPDNHSSNNNHNSNPTMLNDAVSEIISHQVIQEVFRRRVKGGDVLKLPIGIGQQHENHNDSNTPVSSGWHVIRVDDLHLRPINTVSSAYQEPSKNVINKIRPKLKGSGAVPLSPNFQKQTARTNIIEDVHGDEEEGTQRQQEEEDRSRRTIYSVPNAKYYKIVTNGCQMNVADSERIMGILEGELGLASLDTDSNDANSGMDAALISATEKNINKPIKHKKSHGSKKTSSNKENTTPDILLLNTCTIRDHAEQKVYDALGPYAAMKRSGHPLAIVVAGCVAQQEGEALLRRFPEIDLVLGPQYIPWLSDLLVEVGKGSQLCMTESMLWSETGGGDGKGWNSSREKDADWMVPIKRGHTVRAWVNVIHGCNEHCTYCVVPSVRGVEQSRSMEAILQECLQLASSGYKEVTLLGQNIDAYGYVTDLLIVTS